MSTRSIITSTLLSFLIMFGLTYVAIDTWGHLYINSNKLYMAGVMSAPMLMLKTVFMRQQLAKRSFWMLTGTGLTLSVLFFLAIRTQFGIGDNQFLRSMISHHSSAIVMCERSDISDQEVLDLCDEIVATQEREIELMQEILSD